MEKDGTYRRTRIAPTPSGFLHLGNVLSFVRTVGVARDRGAKVLLRIDDMDRERVEPKYVQDIFDTLNFLELPWEEGPRNVEEFESEWSQVHRLGMYREALEVLRGKGEAVRQKAEGLRREGVVFACECSRARVLRDSSDGVYPGTCRDRGISLDAANVSWRLRTGDEEVRIRVLGGGIGTEKKGEEAGTGRGIVSAGELGEMDEEMRSAEKMSKEVRTGQGIVSARVREEMRDFVVRKRDGFPAYQLSSVVDDLHFGVDVVVRGNDLWESTVAQHYLAGKMGREKEFGAIAFNHHALLTGEGGRKLSKSAGDTSIQYLRKQGWKKKDVYTMLARMMGMEGEAASWEELLVLEGRNG